MAWLNPSNEGAKFLVAEMLLEGSGSGVASEVTGDNADAEGAPNTPLNALLNLFLEASVPGLANALGTENAEPGNAGAENAGAVNAGVGFEKAVAGFWKTVFF